MRGAGLAWPTGTNGWALRVHSAYPDKTERVARVRELAARDMTLGRISYLAGVPRSTVRRWLLDDGEVQPRASRRRRKEIG